jgi:very-short-patch-repair endonuclease/predicted transcriptional regulator of viral defense system
VVNVLHRIDEERWSSADRAIAELGARQHGVVARAQLRALGLERGAIDLRLRRGRLHAIQRGVYAVDHRRLTIQGHRLAAVLTYGDGALLSHRAAAAHWGLRPSEAIEVTLPRTARGRPGVLLHRLPLPPDEVTSHDGIPVTTVPRTIFDLAALGRRAVERALHEAEHRQLTDPLSLADLAIRYAHRKHAGVIRAVLADRRPGGTANDFEEAFFTFLERRGFPLPRTNEWIQLGERWIRPDFSWPDQRLIVETDGGTHRTTYGQRSDNARDRAAQAHGWRVIRIGWWALENEADEIEADLRRALQR